MRRLDRERSGTATPALVCDNLHFAYPDGQRALRGLSLVVEPGERVALLGPNGAGKSTLALHLNGILEPQRGSVTVSGLSVTKKNLKEVRRRVGVVFQDPDDMLFMPTVRQDVAFGPSNLGLSEAEIAERVVRALDMVGMRAYANRPPHHLSFGQRKRVATAAVLSMEPEILVLDEPSSNLDPCGRRQFGEILGSLELTMLLITHDLPYAFQLCNRAVVIDEGSLCADGDIRDVLADCALLRAHALELPAGFTLAALDR